MLLGHSRSNCVTATSEFEILHTEAKEIFFGALKACDIASSLDRRIRFEGDVLHRLTADGTSSSVIDMGRFQEIFVFALGKAPGSILDAWLERMKRRKGLHGFICWKHPPLRKATGLNV